MATVVDLVLTYQFIKRLVQPFNETEAFKLGIIDEVGSRIKTKEVKDWKNETPDLYKRPAIFIIHK